MKYLSSYTQDKQTALFDETGAFFAFSQQQFDDAKIEGLIYVSLSGKEQMIDFKYFSNRLSMRLESHLNKNKVRTNAVDIEKTIRNEMEIINDYNSKNDTFINSDALYFVAHKLGQVPSTKVKQNEWLRMTIDNLSR